MPWRSQTPAPMGVPTLKRRCSKAKKPTTSLSSSRTATLAVGRTRPTASANPGDRNALSNSGSEHCIRRHARSSPAPRSPGRTTDAFTGLLRAYGRFDGGDDSDKGPVKAALQRSDANGTTDDRSRSSSEHAGSGRRRDEDESRYGPSALSLHSLSNGSHRNRPIHHRRA